MNSEELRQFLDYKAEQYESPDFISSDPIQIVHDYQSREDREIMGLIMATIAWGNRKAIITSGKNIQRITGNSPYDFVMNFTPSAIPFVHRTFNGEDLAAFFSALRHVYHHYGTLESAFQSEPGAFHRINAFRARFVENDFPSRTHKHVANPLKNSSAKRINMFLRWMVRPAAKGVDFGIWRSIGLSELEIPLDVHTGNISRKLGLLDRRQNDWTSVDLLGRKLREFDPKDPCKYDFALFGLGAFEDF